MCAISAKWWNGWKIAARRWFFSILKSRITWTSVRFYRFVLYLSFSLSLCLYLKILPIQTYHQKSTMTPYNCCYFIFFFILFYCLNNANIFYTLYYSHLSVCVCFQLSIYNCNKCLPLRNHQAVPCYKLTPLLFIHIYTTVFY